MRVLEIFVLMICFIMFVGIEGVVINGVSESFKEGQVFHKIAPTFIDKHRKKWWTKPFYSCVVCMSSVWGSFFFWGVILTIFGFHPIEIWIWIINTFSLVVVNSQIYKRL